MKKLGIALGVVFFIISANCFAVSLSVKVPFNGLNKSDGTGSASQTWYGGGIGIEHNFFFLSRKFTCPDCGKEYTKMSSVAPTFGVEFNYNYEKSSGKSKDEAGEIISEYREDGTALSLLLKYYFPIDEKAKWYPFVGGGPKFRMFTREIKTDSDSDYVEVGDVTEMRFVAPMGFEYSISNNVRFIGFGEFSFNFGALSDNSYNSIYYGLGIGIKKIL